MSRFLNTRLLYVPSLKRCVRFNEFRNEHLLALYRTSDSLPDSICAQWDIIEDCIVDTDIDIRDLNLVDILFIFLAWRVNCVDEMLVYGEGVDDVIDVTEWFGVLDGVANASFKHTMILPQSGLKIGMDLPTLKDDMEMQRVFMMGGKGYDNRIKENAARHTICLLRSVNDVPIESYSDKERLFNTLPPKDGTAILKHTTDQINELMGGVNINLGLDNTEVKFALDLIPVLVKFIFSGNPEGILQESLYLSKKCNINYDDFMKMTPMDSKHFVDFMDKSSNDNEEQGNEGLEDLTDDYFEQI